MVILRCGSLLWGVCLALLQVHFYKIGPQGQENIIGVVKAVILFNEVAVLDGGLNPIMAETFKDSLICRVGRDR